jgi:putative restriction endonuclease
MNAVLESENVLKDTNYILRPNPDNHYWANISAGRLRSFVSRCGINFNIVFVGSRLDEGDFYTIPYRVIQHALVEQFRTPDKTGRLRWVAQIKHHTLKIGRYPVHIDVGAFFSHYPILTNPAVVTSDSAAYLNDYSIENRKIEIEQRQKQSVFRNRVLENFAGRCCLSGITEQELLVASHIVPWAERIDTRLDPRNGLLLFYSYDRLFDRGFISFDDDLRVIIAPWANQCSQPLGMILQEISGRQACSGSNWPINPEYLAYHRAKIFRAKLPDREI